MDGQGGVGILVKNSVLKSAVTLNTNLQAIAANVTIRGKAYTVCSIYVPPSSNPTKTDFDNIIDYVIEINYPFFLYSPPSRYSSDERDEIESLDDDIQSMKLKCGLGF